MAEAFTLTADTSLLREGDHNGPLEYVPFMAEDGGVRYKWSVTNTGISRHSRTLPSPVCQP